MWFDEKGTDHANSTKNVIQGRLDSIRLTEREIFIFGRADVGRVLLRWKDSIDCRWYHMRVGSESLPKVGTIVTADGEECHGQECHLSTERSCRDWKIIILANHIVPIKSFFYSPKIVTVHNEE
jgi:hypothetical protein